MIIPMSSKFLCNVDCSNPCTRLDYNEHKRRAIFISSLPLNFVLYTSGCRALSVCRDVVPFQHIGSRLCRSWTACRTRISFHSLVVASTRGNPAWWNFLSVGSFISWVKISAHHDFVADDNFHILASQTDFMSMTLQATTIIDVTATSSLMTHASVENFKKPMSRLLGSAVQEEGIDLRYSNQEQLH